MTNFLFAIGVIQRIMSDNLVLDLSMQFSIDIVNLCEIFKGKSVLINQLFRSGTSIGVKII